MKKLITLVLFYFFVSKSFAQLPPASPTGVLAAQVALNNSIKVDWTSSTSASTIGYKVYFKKAGTPEESNRVAIVTTKTLTNLVYNQTYKIYLRAYRQGATATDTIYSAKSDSVNVTIVGLIAPQIFAEPTLNTSTSAGLRIVDQNQLETGFEVEFTSPNGTTIIRNLTAPVPASLIFTQNGLLPKTTYEVRARAKYGSALSGPWSTLAYVTTNKDFPPSPVLSESNNCPAFTGISWTIATRAEDIEYFVIQRSFDNLNFETLSATEDPTKRSYFDNGPVPGKNIYYKIIAVNSTGPSPSNIITIAVKNYVAPNPVSNVISDISQKTNSRLVFKWTNGTIDAVCGTNKRTEIVVFVRYDNTGNFEIFKRIPDYETSITIPNLKPKQLVEIEIASVSDKGLVSTKIYAQDRTAGPPDAPSNMFFVSFLNATGVTTHTLEWKDNSTDEDYFIIERGFTTSTFMQMAVIKADLNKFNDLVTEEGVIYYYRVRGGSIKEGNGPYSNIVGPVITEYTKPPHTPWGLKAVQNGQKVDLTWMDDSIREENYIIEKSQDNGATYSLVATLLRNTVKYTDENVTGGKTYIYRLKSANTKGSSEYSKVFQITLSGTGFLPNVYNIYPNPFVNEFTISKISEFENKEEELNLKIYNSSNKLILEKKVKINSAGEVNVRSMHLEQGLYTIVLENGDKKTSKRVLKL
jgi:Secretion system C-terminal sorting domain/Fibronectin type III domain